MFDILERSQRSQFRYAKRKPGSVMLSGFRVIPGAWPRGEPTRAGYYRTLTLYPPSPSSSPHSATIARSSP